MKHFQLLLATLFFSFIANAQPPQKMSYQMVVRNSSNVLVSNQAVGVKISLLQGSATGTAVFVETHTPTTNANGLASLIIGNGTTVTGSFASVDWANGPYFIKTETDPAGGINYTITGNSQLMSVPYALFAGGTPNLGKTYLVIESDITTAEASALIARDKGINTQYVYIRNTSSITTLDLSKIINLVELKVEGNTSLTEIILPDATNIIFPISIKNNNALTQISMPLVNSIPNMEISENPSLSIIQMPSLTKAKGYIQINNNIQLPIISFPLLNSINGYINFYALNSLSSILLPNLTNAKSYLTIDLTGGAPSLNTTISLPKLKNVTGDFTIYGLSINSINLPLLDTAYSWIYVQNTSITSLSFPQLKIVKSSFNIVQNPNLASISIPLLTEFGQTNTFGSSIYFNNNKLPPSEINSLLNKLVNVLPILSGKKIRLELQNPLASPTGQGLADKTILQSRPNTVTTN